MRRISAEFVIKAVTVEIEEISVRPDLVSGAVAADRGFNEGPSAFAGTVVATEARELNGPAPRLTATDPSSSSDTEFGDVLADNSR